MFRLLVLFAAFTIAAANHRIPVSKVCAEKPVELGIVFDSSRSVLWSEFQQGMLLVRGLIRYYDIGPKQTRVAFVIYGDRVQQKMSFGLSKFKTREAMTEYLDGIHHIYGKSSRTGNAIDFMRKVYLAPREVRPDVTKVMIVITDGHSKCWRKLEQAAADAMADGIEMIAIGFGKETVNYNELLKITGGHKDRVVTRENYLSLINVLKELREVVCFSIKLPASSTIKTHKTSGDTIPFNTMTPFTTIQTFPTTTLTAPTTTLTAPTTTEAIPTTTPTAPTTTSTAPTTTEAIPTTTPTAPTTTPTAPTTTPTAPTTTLTAPTTTLTAPTTTLTAPTTTLTAPTTTLTAPTTTLTAPTTTLTAPTTTLTAPSTTPTAPTTTLTAPTTTPTAPTTTEAIPTTTPTAPTTTLTAPTTTLTAPTTTLTAPTTTLTAPTTTLTAPTTTLTAPTTTLTAPTTTLTAPTTTLTAPTTTLTSPTTTPTAPTTTEAIPTTILTAPTTTGTIPTTTQITPAITQTIPTTTWSNPTTIPKTSTTNPKESECEAELAIVMDSSIPTDDFKHGKLIALLLLSALDIGPSNVRVAFTLYGNGIYTDISFNLNTFDRKDGIVDFIRNVPHQYVEKTHTAQAIRYMTRKKMAAHLVRKDVKKFGLVITDGNSEDVAATTWASHEAASENITMLAVGVGIKIHNAELLAIAGGQQNAVFNAKDYPNAAGLAKELKDEICEVKKPAPVSGDTGCVNPSNVLFVFSQSTLGSDNTVFTSKVVENVVESGSLNPKNKYLILSDSCIQPFKVETFETAQSCFQQQENDGVDKLPSLVKAASLYASKSKVVVVIFSALDENGLVKIEESVRHLETSGVKVIHVDVSDNGVGLAGVTTLSNSDPIFVASKLVSELCS